MRKATVASLLILCGSTAAIAHVATPQDQPQTMNNMGTMTNDSTMSNDVAPPPPAPDPMPDNSGMPPNGTM